MVHKRPGKRPGSKSFCQTKMASILPRIPLRTFQVSKRWSRCLRRKLSSVSAAATESTLSDIVNDTNNAGFICSEQNPEEHSRKSLGAFYTIPGKTVSSLFNHGIPKATIMDEVKTIGNFTIMIRKPALSILEQIESNESIAKRFVIYGQDGCGKTMTLSHILHYCFNKQWCILLIPSVFKIVHSKRAIVPSSYNPERFDQPDQALSWLRTFQALNDKHLPQIKTTKEYKVSQKISIASGKPIATVIDQAFHRPNFATDAVGITLKEVQRLRNEVPVLFAADEFNGFFWRTSLKNPETTEWLKPQDLALVHYFQKLFKKSSCLLLNEVERHMKNYQDEGAWQLRRCVIKNWNGESFLLKL